MKKLILFFIIVFAFTGCVAKFEPPEEKKDEMTDLSVSGDDVFVVSYCDGIAMLEPGDLEELFVAFLGVSDSMLRSKLMPECCKQKLSQLRGGEGEKEIDFSCIGDVFVGLLPNTPSEAEDLAGWIYSIILSEEDISCGNILSLLNCSIDPALLSSLLGKVIFGLANMVSEVAFECYGEPCPVSSDFEISTTNLIAECLREGGSIQSLLGVIFTSEVADCIEVGTGTMEETEDTGDKEDVVDEVEDEDEAEDSYEITDTLLLGEGKICSNDTNCISTHCCEIVVADVITKRCTAKACIGDSCLDGIECNSGCCDMGFGVCAKQCPDGINCPYNGKCKVSVIDVIEKPVQKEPPLQVVEQPFIESLEKIQDLRDLRVAP